MAVLDTSVLIDIFHNHPFATGLFREIEAKESVFISSVTVMELWQGVLESKKPEAERRLIEKALENAYILDFDFLAAKKAAEIRQQLKHEPIDPEDVMIAALADVHGETLVTRDPHFARIPGLRILKY